MPKMRSPLGALFHWGPLSVLVIIKVITWMTLHGLSMWWPARGSLGGAVNCLIFLFLAGGTLFYFLNALWEGPGYVPLGWRPEKEEDTQFLQFCSICKGFKAPRSHHCRKCKVLNLSNARVDVPISGRCVKKMDHHCPWINGCVGWANHRHFTYFLFFGVVGCFHATVILSICMYHAINRVWYIHYGTGREPMIYLTLTTLLLSLFALGMAVGVVLAVGMLLYFQIKSILRNQTTIEDWIVEKSQSREEGAEAFVYPYDLGWRKNWALVMENNHYDGIKWPVREGCGEYDLTREQIAQKQEKRQRARRYRVERTYSGRWLPVCAWPRACLAAPCSDEPRVALQPGDIVCVTRWRKHWLFGEVVGAGGDARAPRGWFPRAAASMLQQLTDKAKPD